MKKILVAVALAMVGTTASAAVGNSKHDLRAAPYNGTFPSACMYCHTPHKAMSAVAPIWARDLAAVGSITAYGGGTVGDAGTKTCLTCHGTAAGIQGIGGISAPTVLPGTKVIGTDLRTEHPVGSATNFTAGAGGFNTPSFTVVDGAIECSTCHDVHNTTVKTGTKLLRDYTGTDFCTECHNK